MVSTWPWTKWPPIRAEAETARSRLTREVRAREPRLVRRKVSGDTPTLKSSGVKEVTVKHVPLWLNASEIGFHGCRPRGK